MKKIMFLLTLVFSLGVVNAFGFNDKVISKNQLPAQAQSFLNENLPHAHKLFLLLELF